MLSEGLGALVGSLRGLDLVVIGGYLVVSLGLGLALRGQSNRDEFLTAGRSMGRITVGLSVHFALAGWIRQILYEVHPFETTALAYALAVVAGVKIEQSLP